MAIDPLEMTLGVVTLNPAQVVPAFPHSIATLRMRTRDETRLQAVSFRRPDRCSDFPEGCSSVGVERHVGPGCSDELFAHGRLRCSAAGRAGADRGRGDRKSTRLNSSHGYISYAVFCLKKKKNKHVGI